jgi:hypothetical protein
MHYYFCMRDVGIDRIGRSGFSNYLLQDRIILHPLCERLPKVYRSDVPLMRPLNLSDQLFDWEYRSDS